MMFAQRVALELDKRPTLARTHTQHQTNYWQRPDRRRLVSHEAHLDRLLCMRRTFSAWHCFRGTPLVPPAYFPTSRTPSSGCAPDTWPRHLHTAQARRCLRFNLCRFISSTVFLVTDVVSAMA